MPEPSDDRRSEIREALEGGLTLMIYHPAPREFQGRLIDVSHRGFRAQHSYPLLEPGQNVHFRYSTLEGDARVIWNRILAGQVETGFLLL
ncbi:MAG: PilZ domain-containing protein [Acidobacteria bacterium]|nr:PilZ domain-containing protein [Acidobacteriota bacterium]